MFSITTIESSTTRPMAIVRPPRVKMLSEKSASPKPMKVISTEVGMETAVMMVDFTLSRKTRITKTAKLRPKIPSVVKSSIDFSINGAWSRVVVTVTGLLSPSSSSAIKSVTPFETSTLLPSGVLVIATARDSLPLTREIEEIGASIRETSATSLINTTPGWPGFNSGNAAKSSTVSTLEPTSTAIEPASSSRVPAGKTSPFCSKAAVMLCWLKPKLAKACWSMSISTRFSRAPLTATSLTPSTCLNSEGAMSSSSEAIASLSPSSALIAKTMIGTSSKLPAITCGVASAGSEPSTELTAEVRASVISFVVRPNSKVDVITLNPCELVALVESMPSRLVMLASNTWETCSSTISGEAPGYGVTTAAVGN